MAGNGAVYVRGELAEYVPMYIFVAVRREPNMEPAPWQGAGSQEWFAISEGSAGFKLTRR